MELVSFHYSIIDGVARFECLLVCDFTVLNVRVGKQLGGMEKDNKNQQK